MIRVQIRELDKVITFARRLPKKIDKYFTQTNQKFMEDFRDAARLRAPKDTGTLKEGITLLPMRRGKNVKKWKLISDAPHAVYQEEGFTPHIAPILNSSKMPQGKYFVSKFTPHIEPALQHVLTKLDSQLSGALNKAIK